MCELMVLRDDLEFAYKVEWESREKVELRAMGAAGSSLFLQR